MGHGVLAPKGAVLFLDQNAKLKTDQWNKPRPADIDEWTHYKYYRPRRQAMVSAKDPDQAGREKLAALPDPPPLAEFDEAIRTRQQAGGHAESSHRVCALMHLANIAIRLGRKLSYDPVRESILGDEEANRLVNLPMRAPWHL